MRAVLLAASAAAIAAALWLGPAVARAPAAPGAEASGAACVPVQHSKRVTKRVRVRRHGKWVKVKRKRIKRWTTCEPPPAPDNRCDPPSGFLQVTARDTSGSTFSLSRPCVTAGPVDVELRNQGEDPHNLLLSPDGPGSAAVYSVPASAPFEVGPLEQAEETVSLTVGQWYLWCDLLTHEQQGMHASLTVGY